MIHNIAPKVTVSDEREAVIDVIKRTIYAIDDNNAEALEDCFLDSEETEMIVGEESWTGYQSIQESLKVRLFCLTTTHSATNFRVKLVNDKKSQVTAHFIGYHFKLDKAMDPSVESFTAGGFYFADVVKDIDDLWKIKKFEVELKWVQGDASIVGS